MKNKLTLIVSAATVILFISCRSHLKQFEKKDRYFDNSSVLGLNAVNADYNYYTKAILEYLLVKQIIDGNSIIYNGTPKLDPSSKKLVTQIALFPKLNQPLDDNTVVAELRKNGVKYCFYDLPKTLKDLGSGFQFNHYVFQSSNRAAMQAFGIVDSQIRETSLYIITDYLQYKDINCTGLPTIRYAVGMRAQFRILQTETESELNGIGSLAGLAAQVETNKKTVNVTIKTIGITGIESRLSIPSNTTFDVKTYSDYEKIIDFIRNMKDTDINDNMEIIVSPQIIPVMDDYRTTIEHTFHPLYESIEVLETKLNELSDDSKIDRKQVAEVKRDITEIKLDLLMKEVEELKQNRQKLLLGNKLINDYSKYTDLLLIINGLENSSSTTLEELKSKMNMNYDDIPSYRTNANPNPILASEKEKLGFESLLAKDLSLALKYFIESENAQNGRTNVYEISRYLKTRKKISLQDDEFWKETYAKILNDFSGHIPPNVQREFRTLSK